MNSQNTTRLYRPDIAIFLICIPFISGFNYYLTYTGIEFGWFFLLTFSIDTVQGYLAWWAVRAFILFLDRVWPYGANPYKRIVVQLVVSIFIGLFTISVTTEIVSWIAKGESAPLSFYTFDLFIISIWFFVINGVYVGLYYFNTWRLTDEKQQQELRERTSYLIVKLGKQDIKLSYDEITTFYVDGEYVAVGNLQKKKYYLDQSLDKTEKEIPGSLFFRMNRQVILHRQSISGFKRVENGKLEILLRDPSIVAEIVIVSRTKAAAFKQWFQQG